MLQRACSCKLQIPMLLKLRSAYAETQHALRYQNVPVQGALLKDSSRLDQVLQVRIDPRPLHVHHDAGAISLLLIMNIKARSARNMAWAQLSITAKPTDLPLQYLLATAVCNKSKH